MDYALMIHTDEDVMVNASPEDVKEHVEAFGAYMKDLTDRGILKAGEPLAPSTSATTIRVEGGDVLTTDGPYAETKEALAGFFIVSCADLDEAIDLAAKMPAAPGSSVEVRPVNEELRSAVAAAAGISG
ncbi:MAG: YciI family protein [Actinomycetota bacterium]